MKTFEGLNDKILELITTLEKSDISTIKNYLSDKNLSEKYISALKTECNNMAPSEALSYLLETAENQLFIIKKVKGIMGLATLLKVSVKTAKKLKKKETIEQAVIYEKSKLYFDENEILKIYFPKILAMKSFKLRKDVDEALIRWYESHYF